MIAEASGCIVIGVDYHLAPEYQYPVQLDQFSAVVSWAMGEEGKKRGISKVAGGGDRSAYTELHQMCKLRTHAHACASIAALEGI